MFSPTEPSILAVAGAREGTFLYGIRNVNSFIHRYKLYTRLGFNRYFLHFIVAFIRLHSFPSKNGTWSARFYGSGTRLLCSDRDSSLVVYDFPTWQQPIQTGKTILQAPGLSNEEVTMYDVCYFSGIKTIWSSLGLDDDKQLYIWSLPDPKGQNCSVNQPLVVLSGHKDSVNCIRCSNDKSILISCDEAGLIKLWAI